MSHSDLDLVVTMPIADESLRTIRQTLCLLIEVPAVKPSRVEQAAQTNSRWVRTSEQQRRRSKRRLRREVFLAGCSLLALVPILSACTLGWSNRPDRIIACSISEPLYTEQVTGHENSPEIDPTDHEEASTGQEMIVAREAITFSSEATAVIPVSAAENPVVLPGYVLPDDSREDSLHEGS